MCGANPSWLLEHHLSCLPWDLHHHHCRGMTDIVDEDDPAQANDEDPEKETGENNTVWRQWKQRFGSLPLPLLPLLPFPLPEDP